MLMMLPSCKILISFAAIMPSLLTPTPFPVPRRDILSAYMPPTADTSSNTPVCSSTNRSISFMPFSYNILFFPLATFISPANMPALILHACAIISTGVLRESIPCPANSIRPFSTKNPDKFPSTAKSVLPVVKTPRLTLMNPKPSAAMPFSLAMTSAALLPATSKKPFRQVGTSPITSFRINLAAPLARCEFPSIHPASSVLLIP